MKRNVFTLNGRSEVRRSSSRLTSSIFAWGVSAMFFLMQTATVWASEAAEAGEEGGKLDPLAWASDTAIFTGVIFLLLCFVLIKFAFGPIAKALDQREQSMNDRINAAERANTDAKELLNQYQQKLADSENEVRAMLENAKSDAQKVAQDIIDKAKDTAKQERQRALRDIEDATDSALSELAAKSANLATSLAGKILKSEINPQAHASLIDQALGEFSKN